MFVRMLTVPHHATPLRAGKFIWTNRPFMCNFDAMRKKSSLIWAQVPCTPRERVKPAESSGRTKLRFFGLLMVFALASLSACSGSRTPQPETIDEPLGAIRLDHLNVIDTLDGQVREDASILIVDGVIEGVFESASDIPSPPNLQVIDAGGTYATPGYNNMHTHTVTDFSNRDKELAMMLANGITGFRQMSGNRGALEARARGRLDFELGPALLTMPGEVLTPFNAGSPDAAEREIERQAEQGADFIKVGLVDRETFFAVTAKASEVGLYSAGHLPGDVSMREAADAGYRAMEHFGTGENLFYDCSSDPQAYYSDPAHNTEIPAWLTKIPLAQQMAQGRLKRIMINPAAYAEQDAIALRQRAIDDFDEEKCRDLARRFAELGTWQVPTLVRLRHQENGELPEYDLDSEAAVAYWDEDERKIRQEVDEVYAQLPEEMKATYLSSYQYHLRVIKIWDEENVPMMIGTDDSGLSPASTMQDEFEELAEAGLSPLKILQMTTIDSARFLGRTNTMGQIAPGMAADIVLLTTNPLESVDNFDDIAAVVRGGRYFSKSDLDALVAGHDQ